jgi:2-pyrone-4,6-dicarboxylate lactonase
MALLPCLPPVPNPRRPTLESPAGACDAHFHIFAPANRFPYAPQRSYTPADAPLEHVLKLHERLGMTYGVAVQGNAHGTDNSAMIDAVQRSGGQLRGVSIVPPETARDELARMRDAGVCALRFHHIAGTLKATFSPLGVEAFLKLAPAMADLELHLQMMIDAAELPEVMPRLASWKRPIVIDHYALASAAKGASDQAGCWAIARWRSRPPLAIM